MALAQSIPFLRKELQALVADNNLLAALTLCKEAIPESSKKFKLILAMQANLRKLNEELIGGVINQREYGLRLAEQNLAMLTFAEGLEADDFKPRGEGDKAADPKRPGFSKLEIILLAIVGMLLVVATVYGVSQYLTEKPEEKGPKIVKEPEKEEEDSVISSIDKSMVLVTGGKFEMGTNKGEPEERPAHYVILSDFYIGKTEVTQEQWRAVMGRDPDNLAFKDCGEKCPVERVNWDDIQEFLRRLNDTLLTGKKYRLPTEAEWEYAARGGNKRGKYEYAGSKTLSDVAWYTSNSEAETKTKTTHPVAKKKANELGLYDMSGNVWEWCQDWYGNYPSSIQTNPTGPKTGVDRVIRGGCYVSGIGECRVANRYPDPSPPTNQSASIGFRLARNK